MGTSARLVFAQALPETHTVYIGLSLSLPLIQLTELISEKKSSDIRKSNSLLVY